MIVPLPILSAVRSKSQGDAAPKGQRGMLLKAGNFGSGTKIIIKYG
jgi:hypothetical protein